MGFDFCDLRISYQHKLPVHADHTKSLKYYIRILRLKAFSLGTLDGTEMCKILITLRKLLERCSI